MIKAALADVGRKKGMYSHEKEQRHNKPHPRRGVHGPARYTTILGLGDSGGMRAARNINLGLDLEGGVSITYQVKGGTPSHEDMDDTIYKLQRRVEQYSTEAQAYQEGTTGSASKYRGLRMPMPSSTSWDSRVPCILLSTTTARVTKTIPLEPMVMFLIKASRNFRERITRQDNRICSLKFLDAFIKNITIGYKV